MVHTVASVEPACSSMTMLTARPDRSTVDRSAAAAPARQTHTSLMATSSWSGSKAAVVVPTAARMRPQLGSAPNSAVFTRLLRATARATCTASSSVAADRTLMEMSFVEPSASPSSWIARSWHARNTAAAADRSTVDLSGRAVSIVIELHAGSTEATVWTNDLSHAYVHENSAYSS